MYQIDLVEAIPNVFNDKLPPRFKLLQSIEISFIPTNGMVIQLADIPEAYQVLSVVYFDLSQKIEARVVKAGRLILVE